LIVTNRAPQKEKLIIEAARRLLSRADEAYQLAAEDLVSRMRVSLDKYLLKDAPDASDQSINVFLDQLQAGDLCLVIACERGNESAWADLVARYSTTVRSAARSAAGSEDAAEDLGQSIWAELHGLRLRDDGRPASKLAYYSGRGSLAGWLRAVVSQLAVDQHRKQARLVQPEDDADFDRIAADGSDDGKAKGTPGSTPNPEITLTTKLAGAEMERALASAIQDMDDEDRLLVKLYYFDNLRLKEAGAVLGVHEATASRRLTRVHGELRKRVEQILTSEHGWTSAETRTAFAEVALHLDTDLEPLLATNAMTSENLSPD
jgi:RNA polymerase sigma-70 factor (ECF subfamily)